MFREEALEFINPALICGYPTNLSRAKATLSPYSNATLVLISGLRLDGSLI